MCSCVSALALDLETNKTDLVYQYLAAEEVKEAKGAKGRELVRIRDNGN